VIKVSENGVTKITKYLNLFRVCKLVEDGILICLVVEGTLPECRTMKRSFLEILRRNSKGAWYDEVKCANRYSACIFWSVDLKHTIVITIFISSLSSFESLS
jgi:hypothetical protein